MPVDLLAQRQPKDLLAGLPAPAKPKTEGFLGQVGDWLVDNTIGGVSADILENARTGTFAQDAGNEQGFLDRAGSLIERGAARVDEGIYNFLGGLGSQKARDAAAVLKAGTTGRDVAGSTQWDNVTGLGSLGSYVLDAGIESLPAMGALAVPYAGPALIAGSQTGNIAAERAANDGRDQITSNDLLTASPAALLSTALDRFGLKGIKNPVGNTFLGRVGGAATREGLTEAAQSGIEYAGGTLGTEAGFDLGTAGSQMLAGGVAGAGMGGAGRVALEPVDAFNARRGGQSPQSGAGTGVEPDMDFEGSLDDLLSGAPAQNDNPLLALPAPQPQKTAKPERAPRPAPVDDGVSIARGIFGDKAQITSGYRGPDHPLSKKNPSSWHAKSRAAVDMKPIPGMTFAQAKAQIEAQGFNLIEAINEVGKGKTKHATGDHWHFVIGKGGAPVGAGSVDIAAGMGIDPNAPIDMPMPDQPGSEQQSISGNIDLPEIERADWQVAPLDGETAPDAQAQPERRQDLMQTQPAAPRDDLPPVTPARLGQISQVVAPRVGPVDTQFELRDLSELIDSASPGYDKTLQPRDRAGRAASGAQVASIAGTLDPAQLGESRLASTGAPIIGADGQVESGNGRIAALRQVYAQFPERAEAYRQMIAQTGLDATGMQMPVLVRRRTTQMTPEQRQAWTRAANERDTMAMSSTEQATADARSLPDTTLSLYRGGAVTTAANRDFVRAFIDRAVAPAERNAMIAPDGSLSVDGARRIRFALLARAYGDSELIGRIAEDTDSDIKAIGNALLEAAPAMAKLRAAIEAGEVPAQYDISANIAEAARMVARSRDSGQSISGMLAQVDAFAPQVPAETEAVLRLFYRDAEYKRARSGVKIADALIDYARLAEAQAENAAQGADMFGNAPTLETPVVLLDRVRTGMDGDTGAQIDLLAPAPESATTAPDEEAAGSDGQAAAARPDGREQDGGSRRAVPTLARGQLRALGIAAELRTEKAAALVGRTASTPKELAEIAQIYRDPRYETFRIFLTKGDTIVHATGISSRSVASAPIMPDNMNAQEFLQDMRSTMEKSGADGYYLLHNHPSGDPTPSAQDKKVAKVIASYVPGYRSEVVINSNKFAQIDIDANGRVRSSVRELTMGEDKLIKASVPGDMLGRQIQRGGDLAVLGKEVQKPGYITVIGTDSKLKVRVILDYPESDTKRQPKALMAMARRIQRQSGSASLFLVGDRQVISSPVVKRAMAAGIITEAIDTDGKSVHSDGIVRNGRKNQMPQSPARMVADEQAPFDRNADTITVDGVERPTKNSNGTPIARDQASLRNFWRWFGDSKVVDAQGRPLVVYHGGKAGVEAFDPAKAGTIQTSDWGRGIYFTPAKWQAQGYATDAQMADDPREKELYQAIEDTAKKYGVSDPMMAGIRLGINSPEYADVQRATNEWRKYREELRAKGGGEVYSTYLKIENPEVYQYQGITDPYLAEMAKANDRDGVIVVNEAVTGHLSDHIDEILVFSPTQIKSVNNRGTFDPADASILREEAADFQRQPDPGPAIRDGLIDKEGMIRDLDALKNAVGSPVEALKGVMRSGLADNARAAFYTMDSRLRTYAKRYNSDAINKIADMFYAQAGTGGGPVTETYHEAVDREGLGRAAQAWRILEPFIGDKEAMDRITRMLRQPNERTRGRRSEAEAAAKIARLLKDTIEYRKASGEDIGEVQQGYFPRWLDVEKVAANPRLFVRQATALFEAHGANNPRASAEFWLARVLDQYAGIDGELDFVDLFNEQRQPGVGRRTAKPRKFGEDADKLLGDFYQNDTGEVLTGYFIGSAKKAEEARRFGDEKLKDLFDQMEEEVRASGVDGANIKDVVAGIVAVNLGRVTTPLPRVRGLTSFLHTASQLGTLDRATITSLTESMMGFVRAGPKYGLPMVIRSAREFAREVRKMPPTEAGRMAEALGIAQSAIIGEAIAARSGFERAQVTRRAQKVQQGFFRATGLEQWTTGTRKAATATGMEFLRQLAMDMQTGNARRATEYLNELGVTDPRAFSRWLLDGGNPTPEQLVGQEANAMAMQYRTALLRFVNQTIMKPSRAEKPKWASHPLGGLFFSLMSYSYGFKKNVLDRTGRMIVRGAKEGDPTLLYPAFGMAALLVAHTVINQPLREAILGGGREDDEEGIQWQDAMEALDRAGFFGAASPLINAIWGLKYRRGVAESLMGPTVGRPADLADKTIGLFTEANSEKTNTAERAAAAAIYDIVLEPAVEAYGVTRLRGVSAPIVWGTGNREGGIVPPDRDIFVEAVAGPKEK